MKSISNLTINSDYCNFQINRGVYVDFVKLLQPCIQYSIYGNAFFLLNAHSNSARLEWVSLPPSHTIPIKNNMECDGDNFQTLLMT